MYYATEVAGKEPVECQRGTRSNERRRGCGEKPEAWERGGYLEERKRRRERLIQCEALEVAPFNRRPRSWGEEGKRRRDRGEGGRREKAQTPCI